MLHACMHVSLHYTNLLAKNLTCPIQTNCTPTLRIKTPIHPVTPFFYSDLVSKTLFYFTDEKIYPLNINLFDIRMDANIKT